MKIFNNYVCIYVRDMTLKLKINAAFRNYWYLFDVRMVDNDFTKKKK